MTTERDRLAEEKCPNFVRSYPEGCLRDEQQRAVYKNGFKAGYDIAFAQAEKLAAVCEGFRDTHTMCTNPHKEALCRALEQYEQFKEGVGG